MRKTDLIADCLRRYAWWRLNRADERDEGRNARSAVALLDAAAYAAALPDDSPVVARLTAAGCFKDDKFHLRPPAERLVRFWHYDDEAGLPADLLEAIAGELEPPQVPAQRQPTPPLHR